MIQIPVTNQPNQSFQVAIPLTGRNVVLDFYVYWNRVAEYWQIDIADSLEGQELITGLPLLATKTPVQNLLAPWNYLGIGSAYVVPMTSSNIDAPGLGDWDTNFVLIWGP